MNNAGKIKTDFYFNKDSGNVFAYIDKALKQDGKSGAYSIYIGNFNEKRPVVNAVIEDDKGEMWIGSYMVNKDGSISTALPNDYEPIKSEDMKYYANQIKEIAILRKANL